MQRALLQIMISYIRSIIPYTKTFNSSLVYHCIYSRIIDDNNKIKLPYRLRLTNSLFQFLTFHFFLLFALQTTTNRASPKQPSVQNQGGILQKARQGKVCEQFFAQLIKNLLKNSKQSTISCVCDFIAKKLFSHKLVQNIQLRAEG